MSGPEKAGGAGIRDHVHTVGNKGPGPCVRDGAEPTPTRPPGRPAPGSPGIVPPREA